MPRNRSVVIGAHPITCWPSTMSSSSARPSYVDFSWFLSARDHGYNHFGWSHSLGASGTTAHTAARYCAVYLSLTTRRRIRIIISLCSTMTTPSAQADTACSRFMDMPTSPCACLSAQRIPDDVLLYIAEELPASEKQRLRGVSSTFLRAALKGKYGYVQVNFNTRKALTAAGRAR
jgi:hypothetical protein